MIKCPSHINFLINPEDLHVYSNMNCMGNTTPAGVAQPMFVMHFYKYAMQLASLLPLTLLPLTLVNRKETASASTGLQPHSMWLKNKDGSQESGDGSQEKEVGSRETEEGRRSGKREAGRKERI